MSLARGGLVGGIGRALRDIGHSFADKRQREEEEREREEAERRRRQREDLNLDLELAQMGGGRGPAPTETFTPNPGQGFQPEEFDPPTSVLPQPDTEPAGAEGFMEVPEASFERPDPVQFERDVPGMRELAGGEFHIEDPEFRRTRQAAEERRRQVAGIGAALEGIGRDPERTDAEARGLVEGLPSSVIFDEDEERPVSWDRVVDRQGRVQQIHPHSGETRDTGITARVPGSGSGSGVDEGLPTGFRTQQAEAARSLFEGLQAIEAHEVAGGLDRAEARARADALLRASPFRSVDEARQFLRTGEFGAAPTGGSDPSGDPGPSREPRMGSPFNFREAFPMPSREPEIPEIGAAPPSPTRGGRRTISRDEADFLRQRRGMTEAEIRRRYRVRGR